MFSIFPCLQNTLTDQKFFQDSQVEMFVNNFFSSKVAEWIYKLTYKW